LYDELLKDLDGPNKYPKKDFIFKVIVSDPVYAIDSKREQVLREIKQEFRIQNPTCEFYTP
jgi:hypothetical protein